MEDTAQEGVLLDTNPRYTKRILSKTYRSVDFSEMEPSTFIPRKNSVDTLQPSTDVRESIAKTRQKLQIIIDSAKTPCERGVDIPFIEADGTYTASPAIITNTPRTESETVWRIRSDFTEKTTPTKVSVSRSPHMTQYRPQESPRRIEPSTKEPVKREIRQVADGLISCTPIRRNARALSIDPASQYKRNDNRIRINLDAKPTEILPEVPARVMRKPRRDVLCRSVGEEVTDSAPIEAKNPILGTIGETNLYDTRTDWIKKDPPDSARLIESETWQQQPYTPGKRARSGAVTTLELRRRNSDPATKLNVEPGKISRVDDLQWQSSTLFTFAGHRFRKVQRFSKDDRCAYCREEMDAFVTQGHKCEDCKQLFHTKCIQNRGVLEMPCLMQTSSGADGKPGKSTNLKK